MSKGLPLIPKFHSQGGSTGLTAKGAMIEAGVPVPITDQDAVDLGDVQVTPSPWVPDKVTDTPKIVKAKAKTPKVKLPVLPKSSLVPPSVDTIHIVLPADLVAKIMKPITGSGGWQTLMTSLQTYTTVPQDGAATLAIPECLRDEMLHKALNYGAGGYQGVIREVLVRYLAEHMHTMAAKGGK